MSKYFSEILTSIRSSIQNFKSQKIVALCEKGKYPAAFKKLNTYQRYSQIQINEYPFLFYLISLGKTETVDQFLTNNKYKERIINEHDNKIAFTPSIFSVLNNLYDINDVLIKHKANIFQGNKEGNTAVHIAAFYNNIQALEYLIKMNFDINIKNEQNETPLFCAILGSHPEAVKFFKDNKKTDFYVQNNKQYYPIHEAVLNSPLEVVKLLDFTLDNVRRLLCDFDVVHLAAQNDKLDILEYLLNRNPGIVNLRDKSEALPLHYAVLSGSLQSVEFLIESKALINGQDKFGNTPLHLAVLHRHESIVRLLIEHSANPRIKNKDGLNPVDICITDNIEFLITYFRSRSEMADLFKPTGVFI